MKFTLILAFASVLTSVISAPTPAPETDITMEKRQTDATSIINTLNSAIAGSVANIESTLSTISASSSASNKSAAASAVTSEVAQMVSAVNAATTSVKALAPSGKLVRRQAGSLQAALTTLLTEVNTIAETLVADLGLTTTLSILNPLVGSLSNLLLSLEVVVNNLLALVQQIVDGLLNGLSAGLAGLTL